MYTLEGDGGAAMHEAMVTLDELSEGSLGGPA